MNEKDLEAIQEVISVRYDGECKIHRGEKKLIIEII